MTILSHEWHVLQDISEICPGYTDTQHRIVHLLLLVDENSQKHPL